MFLPVPQSRSNVAGLNIEINHYDENIAGNSNNAQYLQNEYLWVIVHHDGSNIWCDAEECHWQFVFVRATQDVPLVLEVTEESEYQIVCLSKHEAITTLTVEEGTYFGVTGIWLCAKSTEDSLKPSVLYNLSAYALAN